MEHFDLAGRVSVVTGGNGGIGLGMARGLARAGSSVAIAGRNAGKNETAVRELRTIGVPAIAIAADLNKAEDCRRLVDQAAEHFGRLDILVNNAGMSYRKAPQDYTLEEWDEVIRTNLSAAFLCAQAAYPHFQAAGGGKVINVCSMMSLFGSSYSVAYGSSKGGLLQLTRSLACAWAKDNIQSNAVLPGWIDTDLSKESRRLFPELDGKVRARTPAGRWGTPADFEAVAVFLAGTGSDFLNGAAIPVDGGYASAG